VKESLLQYVRTLGEISYGLALVEHDDELIGSFVADRHEPDGTRITQYSGEIHLRTHDGHLNVVIADPEVRLAETQGQLRVRTSLDGRNAS